jgi:serine O-acetyltransferase
MTGERPSWRATISKLKADRLRLAQLLWREPPSFAICFHPSFVCVLLYRISHRLFEGGHKLLARFVAQFNELLTGADITPESDLDEGLVILTPPGTAICGKAGRNLTVMPCSGLGGEIGRRDDIGAGPGLPVLGDDVILEPHCGVLGPARIGNRVRVCAGVLVTRNVPDDSVAEGPPPRFLARQHSL